MEELKPFWASFWGLYKKSLNLLGPGYWGRELNQTQTKSPEVEGPRWSDPADSDAGRSTTRRASLRFRAGHGTWSVKVKLGLYVGVRIQWNGKEKETTCSGFMLGLEGLGGLGFRGFRLLVRRGFRQG